MNLLIIQLTKFLDNSTKNGLIGYDSVKSKKYFGRFNQRWFFWIRFGCVKQLFQLLQPSIVGFIQRSWLIFRYLLVKLNKYFSAIKIIFGKLRRKLVESTEEFTYQTVNQIFG